MEHVVRSSLRFDYGHPAARDQDWCRRFLELSFCEHDEFDDQEGQHAQVQQRRILAASAFAEFFNHRPWEFPPTHYCSLECTCRDADHAKDRAWEFAEPILLQSRISVATLTRWTKFIGPTKYVCRGVGCFGVLRLVLETLHVPSHRDGREDMNDDSELSTEKQKVRLKKALELLQTEGVLQLLILALISVSSLRRYIGILFTQSKEELKELSQTYRGPIFDLVTMRMSPAVRLVSECSEMLFNFRPGFEDKWFLLTHPIGGWSPVWRYRVLVLMVRIACQSWHRFIAYYHHYPWPLARIVDSELTPEERRDAADQFVHGTCRDCLDEGFSEPLSDHIEDPTDLFDSSWERMLRSSFNHVKTQTIPVEECFKRSRVNSWSSHGKSQHAATIASNHFLGELRSKHTFCRRQYNIFARETGVRPPDGLVRRLGRPRRRLSGWWMLVRDVEATLVRGADETLKQFKRRACAAASAQWLNLSVARKAALATQQAREQRVRDRLANVRFSQRKIDYVLPSDRTPWGCGDSSYGVSLDLAAEMMGQKGFASAGHQRWLADNSSRVTEFDAVGYPRDLGFKKKTCSEVYGIGRCGCKLAGPVKLDMEWRKTVLSSIVRSWPKSMSDELPLLVLIPEQPVVRPIFLLAGYMCFNPEFQVYVRCEPILDDAGRIVEAHIAPMDGSISIDSLMLDFQHSTDVAYLMASVMGAGHWLFKLCAYTCPRASHELVLDEAIDLDQLAGYPRFAEIQRSRDAHPEGRHSAIDAALKALRGRAAGGHGNRGRDGARDGGRAPGRGGSGAVPGEFDVAGSDDSEAGDEAGPSPELQQEIDERSDADVGPDAPPPPPPMPPPSAAGAAARPARPAAPMPDKHIYTADGAIAGQITLIYGSRSVSCMIKCRSHGCARAVGDHLIPDIDLVREWVRRGPGLSQVVVV